MGQIPSRTRKIVEAYIKELEKNGIHVRQAVVFGSYSTGRAHEWSDIDIALVSDAFEGIRMRDRNKIRRITLRVSTDLSPIPFRPGDFTPEDPFVREIIEHGIRVV
jgi:predicted nucleotidyltransferase